MKNKKIVLIPHCDDKLADVHFILRQLTRFFDDDIVEIWVDNFAKNFANIIAKELEIPLIVSGTFLPIECEESYRRLESRASVADTSLILISDLDSIRHIAHKWGYEKIITTGSVTYFPGGNY